MRLHVSHVFRFSKRLSSFITTPIFYANAEPHIGHAYTSIIADAAHRWQLLKFPDENHIFCTGTDEHGSKIYQAALKAKKTPKNFCDEVSGAFRGLFENLQLSNTHFIRTTDSDHVKAVQNFWEKLEKAGYIYKSTYSGYYSIVDECFYERDEVEEKEIKGVKCMAVKNTQTVVEWVEEDNYMFRLSSFRQKVQKWLNENDVVRPKNYLAHTESYFDMEEDLSISRCRKRVPWGIPVPNDPSQTIYVWVDALVNYLTVSGYPGKQKIWPPTCQIIGKDILKFHAFYWPAFLMAADLPLPKLIFVHGHWLVDNVKMSKSIGNVVRPHDVISKYSVEGLRYFILKQGNPHTDSNYTTQKCLEILNSDLVNNIGNLLNRSTVEKMNPGQKYAKVVAIGKVKELASDLLKQLNDAPSELEVVYDDLLFYKACEILMRIMKEANRFFQSSTPWKVSDDEELLSILYITYESVRIVNILMQPIVPEFSNFCLDRLGVPIEQRKLQNAKFGNYAGGDLGTNKGIVFERLLE